MIKWGGGGGRGEGGKTSGSPGTKREGMVGEVEEEKFGRGTLKGWKAGEITGQCSLQFATKRSNKKETDHIPPNFE